MPLSDKNLEALRRVADSIREMETQREILKKPEPAGPLHCEWGRNCQGKVEHRCGRCQKYLCQADTEVWRVPRSEPPTFVRYCPGCYSIVSARWSRRQPGK